MIIEDYVSFEIAKLLKEKGFQQLQDNCGYFTTEMIYSINVDDNGEHYFAHQYPAGVYNKDKYIAAPTLWVAMKWLRDNHNIVLVVDYDYECTNTSYCYKIYKLGEYGKPERVPIEGTYCDKHGNECVSTIIYYSNYKRSYDDYKTYEEACEAGIKYCLQNLT